MINKDSDEGQKIIDITKTIFHNTLELGELDYWFSFFNKDSIYSGNGCPMLFGQEAIIGHFKKLNGVLKDTIIEQEYYPLKLANDIYTIDGRIVLKKANTSYIVLLYYSITYNIKNKKIIILRQTNAYEYINEEEPETKMPALNKSVLKFVQNLILNKNYTSKIAIKSADKTIFIHPGIILYITSNGNTTKYVCIDRVITSTQSLSEIENNIPDCFLKIHRCYIVNTDYVISVKRFELELIPNIKLPIPEKNYTKIKSKLKEMMII